MPCRQGTSCASARWGDERGLISETGPHRRSVPHRTSSRRVCVERGLVSLALADAPHVAVEHPAVDLTGTCSMTAPESANTVSRFVLRCTSSASSRMGSRSEERHRRPMRSATSQSTPRSPSLCRLARSPGGKHSVPARNNRSSSSPSQTHLLPEGSRRACDAPCFHGSPRSGTRFDAPRARATGANTSPPRDPTAARHRAELARHPER